ncbi:probable thiamine biosynthetic bifunctional enzyme, chloroplastic isoform X1 [Nymphaea colorata]|nr:probable thiamine biosynthetic bifunctional enzyme, chloroplastic isoform X1 [Nymphaea colorata]
MSDRMVLLAVNCSSGHHIQPPSGRLQLAESFTKHLRPLRANIKMTSRNLSDGTIKHAETLKEINAISKVPHVMTVAGSDSGAGAGIQADLKACAALGVFCSSVITAVTAQNTCGVQGIHEVPENFIYEQLKSVLSDMHVDVVKTGMLPSVGVVKVLCDSLKEFPVKALVVDPVMVSTSGDALSGPSVLDILRKDLLPMADIVTPNLKEASTLLGGTEVKTVADMHSAAKSIYSLGPRNVLVKGGHLPDSSDAIDVFFDGVHSVELQAPRIRAYNTHGTGCTLASCIAAELAKGSPMLPAVQAAKQFVEQALEHSQEFLIGSGPQRPFNHLFMLQTGDVKQPQKPFKPADLFLYAVTDSGMNKKWGRSISEAVKAAIEGGATIVQLREKEAETKKFVEAAEECMEICKSFGVPLLINDRIDVALACDADGVHVGQSDMSVPMSRKLLGPGKIIGVSCKTPEQARKAWLDGADYIGCGGMFPTNTKQNNPTIGLAGLKAVCESSPLPVVAIGGIGIKNAHLVMESGFPNLSGVAVVSALFDRESISEETRRLKSVISKVVSN